MKLKLVLWIIWYILISQFTATIDYSRIVSHVHFQLDSSNIYHNRGDLICHGCYWHYLIPSSSHSHSHLVCRNLGNHRVVSLYSKSPLVGLSNSLINCVSFVNTMSNILFKTIWPVEFIIIFSCLLHYRSLLFMTWWSIFLQTYESIPSSF